MATVQDVIRFENGAANSKYLMATGNWGEYNKHVERIESAMEEEFGVGRGSFKHFPKTRELGPKATSALEEANQSNCLGGGSPLLAMKATALTVNDLLDDWLVEAKKKGSTHIVVGNDSWDYEDFPIYVSSSEEAQEKKKYLDETGGVYYVKTVVVR